MMASPVDTPNASCRQRFVRMAGYQGLVKLQPANSAVVKRAVDDGLAWGGIFVDLRQVFIPLR